MEAHNILSTQDNRGELMFQRLRKIKTWLSTFEEAEKPEETTEKVDKKEHQNNQANDGEAKSPGQLPARAHKYTNVTFPRGFSPSQCSLLASRQRSANYLYFSTNERGEFLTNKNSCQTEKTTKRKKKKSKASRSHVINSAAKLGSRYLKPVLPFPARKETSSLSSFSHQSARTYNKTSFEAGSISSLRTGQTSQTRWKSKEKVAKNLAEHVQELLKIQSSETIAEIQRVERTLYHRKSKNCCPPHLPVYLFDKNRPTLNSISQ